MKRLLTVLLLLMSPLVLYGGTTTFITPSVSGTITGSVTYTGTVSIDADGVVLDSDNDGALSITGQGNGFDENLTINFDDVSNTIGLSSTTSASTLNLGALDLAMDSGGVINWNSGGITCTESSDNLLFAGATTSYTFDNTIISSVSNGAATLQNTVGGTNQQFIRLTSTGADSYWGSESASAGAFFTDAAAYSSVWYTSTSQQFIIGGVSRMTLNTSGNVIVGNQDGLTTARTGNTLRAPNVATGGAGNLDAADLTIAAGLGTGTGDPGQIIFQAAPVAAAGDNLQSLATVMTIDGSGDVGIGTSSPLNDLAGGTDDWVSTGSGLHVKATDVGTIINEGNAAAYLSIDTGGASNDKIMSWITDGGVSFFRSYNDDLTTNVDNILVMDLGSGNVGIATTSPGARLDVSSGDLTGTAMFGADLNAQTRTNATRKLGIFATPHYTNAEEAMAILVADSNTTTNSLTLGGGSSSLNAATSITFNTAADATTLSGTARMTIGTSTVSMGDDVLILRDVNAGITASVTQSQGNGALTAEINEVATVGSTNDTVTLPTAVAGLKIIIINNGANTLQIFPASGDNLGAGVDTATTLASGSNIQYVSYDNTNWEVLSSTL